MAIPSQTPVITHPPPGLPSIPDAHPALVNYLRTFSLWATTAMSKKISGTQALPGVLLQAYDTAAGAPPKVFLIRVNSAGVVSATAQPLGDGAP